MSGDKLARISAMYAVLGKRYEAMRTVWDRRVVGGAESVRTMLRRRWEICQRAGVDYSAAYRDWDSLSQSTREKLAGAA